MKADTDDNDKEKGTRKTSILVTAPSFHRETNY